MPKSVCDPEKDYNTQIWVISMLNVGAESTADDANFFGGHSALFVEGLTQQSPTLQMQPFKGFYDLKATVTSGNGLNAKGYVSEIRVFENEQCTRDVSRLASLSFLASKDAVLAMVESIKSDHSQLEGARQTGQLESFMPFSMLRFVWTNNETVNCTNWCKQKLDIAGIDIMGKKPSTCCIS